MQLVDFLVLHGGLMAYLLRNIGFYLGQRSADGVNCGPGEGNEEDLTLGARDQAEKFLDYGLPIGRRSWASEGS